MELMRQMAAVAGVLLLVAGMWWGLRRKGLVRSRSTGRRLQVLERLPLTAQHSVVLVRSGGRVLLLGLAPSRCTVLETHEWQRFASGEEQP